MPKINEITSALADWLKLQKLTPQIREVSLVGVLPPATYPHIAINVEDEQFGPHSGDITALVSLQVSHAGGRPADALTTVRDLAHQVRHTLAQSQCLSSLTKSFMVRAISYDNETAASADSLVVAKAELLLELKYCETQL